MRLVIFLFTLFTVWACSKSDEAVPANALVGTWRLATYCKPTSGSACTSVTVPAGKNVFADFTNNGTFNERYENTKPVEYGFLGCGGGTYQIEGDNLRITASCMSSTYGQLFPILSINPDRLTLNPFGTGEYIFERIH